MKMVPRDLLEAIRARSDIVEVIGERVPLTRAGARFKACCPFHQEKTPSFFVNPQMQAFHCFGCGAGGDVFRFVMAREGVDFMTAVRLLARRAGVPVALTEGERKEAGEKDALYALHEDLAAFYHETLRTAPDAEAARAYLAGRSLDGEATERFRLGFAPARAGVLAAWAKRTGVATALLVRGGILAESDRPGGNRYYDRFRGRLMIPIQDELGRVIAFSGRVLRAEDSPAKYVNSPETPLFRKSRVLFGLFHARKAIVEARRAVLCEGQLDTIRCQIAGLATAVAAQGTAVTEEHARTLARYADEVVLVMDPDEAGRKAALRSARLLLAGGLGVRIAALPEGADPDTWIRRDGPDPLREAIERADRVVGFLVRDLERRGELGTESGVRRGIEAILDLAKQAPNEVFLERLLHEAAEHLWRSPAVSSLGAASTPVALLGRLERALRADLRRLPPAPATRSEPGPGGTGSAPAMPPEEFALLELALVSEETRTLASRYLRPGALANPDARRALAALLRGGREALRAEAERAEDAFARLVGRLALSPRIGDGPSGEVPPAEAARGLIARIWRRRLEERRAALRARLREATGGDPALETERMELTMRIAALGRDWTRARAVIEVELDAEPEPTANSAQQ